MDEKILQTLAKQLKILNFWITVYGALILMVLAFLSFMIFRMVTYINNLNAKVSNFNPKDSYCQNVEADSLEGRLCN